MKSALVHYLVWRLWLCVSSPATILLSRKTPTSHTKTAPLDSISDGANLAFVIDALSVEKSVAAQDVPADTNHLFLLPGPSVFAFLCPQGHGRTRAYAWHPREREIDKGRWFFPNVDNETHGIHQEEAFVVTDKMCLTT